MPDATTRPDYVAVDDIEHGDDLQQRVQHNPARVGEYAERIEAGDHFPPISLVYDGDRYYCWDGHYRLAAHLHLGRSSIEATVERGTRKDAVWLSCGANRTNGLPRTNEDKRRAVLCALQLRPRDSDRAIADHCGVSDKTVGKIRGGLSAEIPQMRTVTRGGLTAEIPQSRTGRDGRTINTSNIGKRAKPSVEPAAKPPADDVVDDPPELQELEWDGQGADAESIAQCEALMARRHAEAAEEESRRFDVEGEFTRLCMVVRKEITRWPKCKHDHAAEILRQLANEVKQSGDGAEVKPRGFTPAEQQSISRVVIATETALRKTRPARSRTTVAREVARLLLARWPIDKQAASRGVGQ